MFFRSSDTFCRERNLGEVFSETVFALTDLPAPRVLTAADTLDGGGVIPGFALPVVALFAGL
jgi:hypothetical protein